MSAVKSQRGMVLVTSLLLLLVVTILAMSMFRSMGLDEKIAGNMRDKQRALNAAETAEQYAENWLSLGNGSNGINCTAIVNGNANPPQVCSNSLAVQSAPATTWQPCRGPSAAPRWERPTCRPSRRT